MSRDMFDDPRSHEADELALRAELIERALPGYSGQHAEACEMYRRAAELEEALARETPAGTPRLRAILAISAVSLWRAAGMLFRAIGLAEEFLGDPVLPASERAILAKLTEDLHRGSHSI